MKKEKITLDVSWQSILKISLLFFLLYIIFLIKEILILFLFALLVSVLFDRPIDYLEKRKIPRILATIFIYLSFFLFLGFLIYFIFPVFLSEIYRFISFFPQYLLKFSELFKKFGIDLSELLHTILQDWIKKEWTSILNFLTSFFASVFSFFTFFFLAFFLSLEKDLMAKIIASLSPKKYEEKLFKIWEKTKQNVSVWFGTKILGSIFVAILLFFACLAFKVKYAVSFSLIAGFLNLIPIVGPFITGILIFVSLTFESIYKALFVLLSFVIIQQIENNIFLPFLTEKFFQISPAVVFLSFLVGGKLLGIFGAVFSIPLFVLVFEFWKEFFKEEKEAKI